MNRRNFITDLGKIGLFSILPGAGRIWKAEVPVPRRVLPILPYLPSLIIPVSSQGEGHPWTFAELAEFVRKIREEMFPNHVSLSH